MKIYFAGNFPQMKNPAEEKSVAQMVTSNNRIYRRLVSFHFKVDAISMAKIKGEMEELENENQSS